MWKNDFYFMLGTLLYFTFYLTVVWYQFGAIKLGPEKNNWKHTHLRHISFFCRPDPKDNPSFSGIRPDSVSASFFSGRICSWRIQSLCRNRDRICIRAEIDICSGCIHTLSCTRLRNLNKTIIIICILNTEKKILI